MIAEAVVLAGEHPRELAPFHELRDSRRNSTTACSTSAAVRAELRRGRLEQSCRPARPAYA
jgi:hypothetical protein